MCLRCHGSLYHRIGSESVIGMRLSDSVPTPHFFAGGERRRGTSFRLAGSVQPSTSLHLVKILASQMQTTLVLISLHSWANLSILPSVERALRVKYP